jgi:hypothetical protein
MAPFAFTSTVVPTEDARHEIVEALPNLFADTHFE